MEEEWEEKRKSCYIQKGFLRGVVMNMQDALDEQYYSQLKHVNTAYCNTTAIQILNHLETQWCPLNVQAQKILKNEFYTDWDTSNINLTAFGMKLDKDQNRLNRLGVIISNKDKLQFYLEQIYASNCFDKAEMVAWENKPILIKDDYNKAKWYFETLVKDFKTYTQNSGSTIGKAGYDSTNQVADMGNEIQKYIQEIASATVADKAKTAELAADTSKATKAKDAQIDSITAQIKLLTDTVALLLKSLANKENNGSNSGGGGSSGSSGSGGGGSGSGSGGSGLGGIHEFRYTCNMGNYCWSHSHHPVGMKHDSVTCTRKKDGHKDGATATNCMGGDNFWPRKHRVKPSQQEQPATKESLLPIDGGRG
jgi:hypothetical protein